MNIVAIYPNLSPKLSSIAQVPVYFGERGHRTVVITCSRMDALKGKWTFPEKETIGNTVFYRPYQDLHELYDKPESHYKEVKKFMEGFKPDILFCSGQWNTKLAMMMKRDFRVPCVLFVEYIRDPLMLLSFRGKRFVRALKLGFLLKPYRDYYWKRLCRLFDAIMYVNHGDRKYQDKISYYGTKIYYVPWCNQIPEIRKEPREKGTGIYIGSLYSFKNAQELSRTIPVILEKTPTRKFIVIGPGPVAKKILKLKNRFGDRLEYIESLTREEALSYLAKSFYAYTPVISAGAGFIGDCWGVRTPLVATHDVGGLLRNREDTLIPERVRFIDRVINELYDNESLYNSLIQKGYERYLRDHTKEAVGEEYLKVFSHVLDKNR